MKLWTLAGGLALACFAVVPQLVRGASSGPGTAEATFRPLAITVAKEPVSAPVHEAPPGPDTVSTTVPTLALADASPAPSVRSIRQPGNHASANGPRQALPSGPRALPVAAVSQELDLIAPY